MTKNVAHIVVEDLGAVIGAFYQVEQASTGPKGKVKTEALKKEREAQVSKVFHIYSQGQGFACGIFPVIFIVDSIFKP